MIEDLIEQIINNRTDSHGSVQIWVEITEEQDGKLMYEGDLRSKKKLKWNVEKKELKCQQKDGKYLKILELQFML